MRGMRLLAAVVAMVAGSLSIAATSVQAQATVAAPRQVHVRTMHYGYGRAHYPRARSRYGARYGHRYHGRQRNMSWNRGPRGHGQYSRRGHGYGRSQYRGQRGMPHGRGGNGNRAGYRRGYRGVI